MTSLKNIRDMMKTDGSRLVAIIETDVLGVKAYHCRCLMCGWESKRKDRKNESIGMANRHRCKLKDNRG